MSIMDGNVPTLGRPSNRVVVVSRKIIAPAGIDVRPEGLDIDGCNCHLRVVDGITGEAWLVPLSPKAVVDVRDQLSQHIPPNISPIGA